MKSQNESIQGGVITRSVDGCLATVGLATGGAAGLRDFVRSQHALRERWALKRNGTQFQKSISTEDTRHGERVTQDPLT